MRQRGRKSKAAASLTLVHGGHPPPKDLTPEEAETWNEIIGRMPPDWFQVQNLPLLKQYCRADAAATRIAEMIRQYEIEGDMSVAAYDALLKMQSRETANLCSLATKMRLAQSAIDETKQGKPNVKPSVTPIWEA